MWDHCDVYEDLWQYVGVVGLDYPDYIEGGIRPYPVNDNVGFQ